LPQRVGDKIARLIGAEKDTVLAADSTSVNLFKMLNAALKMRRSRKVILSERGNFPTCLYVAQGTSGLLEGEVELRLVETPEAVMGAIDDSIAVVLLTHVNFRTSRMHDLAAMTKAAHAAGALVVWDLAHSAGAVPIDVTAADVDFAVGCCYKYLNGGPGAPGYLYIRKDLQNAVVPAVQAWWGHAEPFAFVPDFVPADGLRRNLCGTAPILSMSALDSALDVWHDVDMTLVREKSLALTNTFITVVERECRGEGLELITPREDAVRGSHVSFRSAHGYEVSRALVAHGVIGDFRAPDLIRFGFAPLYVRHVDAYDAAMHLAEILKTRRWAEPEFARPRLAS
jgi:kynureninase